MKRKQGMPRAPGAHRGRAFASPRHGADAMKPASVLVLGSGPIVIGQAAEFDYAGTQACKAMREEGIRTILVNSNPATIMTDDDVADAVYIEPLTVPVLERIIARERPDGLLPTLGGQTGLNLARRTRRRRASSRSTTCACSAPSSRRSGWPRTASSSATCWRDRRARPRERDLSYRSRNARLRRAEIGLPLVVRPAYTLGGTGGGMAYTRKSCARRSRRSGLAASPDHPGPGRDESCSAGRRSNTR